MDVVDVGFLCEFIVVFVGVDVFGVEVGVDVFVVGDGCW